MNFDKIILIHVILRMGPMIDMEESNHRCELHLLLLPLFVECTMCYIYIYIVPIEWHFHYIASQSFIIRVSISYKLLPPNALYHAYINVAYDITLRIIIFG